MDCEQIIWEICFVKPKAEIQLSIFGFAEFISALALLVIVYTVTDFRYRFRIAIAPIPLFRLTYVLIAFIGLATLLTDIWIAEQWLIPNSYISYSVWQGFLGVLFLTMAMVWIFFAFIKPPTFCELLGFSFKANK